MEMAMTSAVPRSRWARDGYSEVHKKSKVWTDQIFGQQKQSVHQQQKQDYKQNSW